MAQKPAVATAVIAGGFCLWLDEVAGQVADPELNGKINNYIYNKALKKSGLSDEERHHALGALVDYIEKLPTPNSLDVTYFEEKSHQRIIGKIKGVQELYKPERAIQTP